MGLPFQVRSTLKYLLAPYPRLFIPACRFLASESYQKLLISKKTEIVIEGFPRSGNTFAVVSFELAQSRKVSIAHHLHVEAQIIEGVRRGLPVMVLIRDPLQAIKSLVIRHPNLMPNKELKNYIRFYRSVESVLDNVLIVDFKQITTDFGVVIHQLNNKFSVNYNLFHHTLENVNKVFAIIEEINKNVNQGRETHISRPSEMRKKVASDINLEFSDSLLDEAGDLYQRLTDLALSSE